MQQMQIKENRVVKRQGKWASLCLFIVGAGTMMQSALADPIGYIDGVRKKNEYWAINGWACEPGAGSAIQVKLLLNDVAVGAAQFTSEPAEDAIHQQCGSVASSGIPYRFTISYKGPLAGQNIRIDASSIDANKIVRTAPLQGSNEFGLPVIDPEAVIASANKILILTAHEDDEIWFSPLIAKYCGNAGKTCKVVASTSNRTYHPDANEFVNATAFLPAAHDLGTFYSGPGSDSAQTTLNRWALQAADAGLVNLNNVVKLEIDKFVPDVILTFDPRHGTSCHPEHRAVGQAVIDGVTAYAGANFNKSNLFLLESRRIDMPLYSASVPAVAKDRFSVGYDMMNFIPARSMTGFDFFIAMMGKYPTQFDADAIQRVLKADKSDMVLSLLPIANYVANDSRYTGSSSDPRISVCPAFASNNGAPFCSSVTLSPNSLPASGGTVSAQANCSGSGLSYVWTVDGSVYNGNLSTNSSPVSPNTTNSPITYSVCVTASNATGQSQPVCAPLVQAAAVVSPTPSAPTIGTAVAGNGAISVNFTPGAIGTGTLVNYTASCGGIFATGTSSPITVNGLSSTNTYFCQVKTTSSVGTSAWSEWSNAVTPRPAVPVCSSVALNPDSLPVSGGTVSAQANCSGSGLSYTWTVNGVVYTGNLSTNSSPVGRNTTSSPLNYAVCVTASNASGTSQPACASLTQAALAPPVCSSVTLTPNNMTASGGAASAQANCTGYGNSYVWTVNGAAFGGTLVTNSVWVSPNTTALPLTHSMCVTATNADGRSQPVCGTITEAATAVALPSAPTIGTAERVGPGVIRVYFTPGSIGTGTFVNYTANCGGYFATGASSPVIVTGLPAGTPFFCKVKAVSIVGAGALSEWSNPVFM